jgi:hypothetical protein
LLAQAHLSGSSAHEVNRAILRQLDESEEELRNSREPIPIASKKAEVAPRIEIVLRSKKINLTCVTTISELRAISVSLPAHAAQQLAISRSKRDQITSTAMIGAEHQSFVFEFSERAHDVARSKRRTIAPDRDHFVIAKIRECLHSILESFRKIGALLRMNAPGALAPICRGEVMHIDPGQAAVAKRRQGQELSCRLRKRAPLELDMNFLSEYEEGSARHPL